jgi:hypothetical protein
MAWQPSTRKKEMTGEPRMEIERNHGGACVRDRRGVDDTRQTRGHAIEKSKSASWLESVATFAIGLLLGRGCGDWRIALGQRSPDASGSDRFHPVTFGVLRLGEFRGASMDSQAIFVEPPEGRRRPAGEVAGRSVATTGAAIFAALIALSLFGFAYGQAHRRHEALQAQKRLPIDGPQIVPRPPLNREKVSAIEYHLVGN